MIICGSHRSREIGSTHSFVRSRSSTILYRQKLSFSQHCHTLSTQNACMYSPTHLALPPYDTEPDSVSPESPECPKRPPISSDLPSSPGDYLRGAVAHIALPSFPPSISSSAPEASPPNLQRRKIIASRQRFSASRGGLHTRENCAIRVEPPSTLQPLNPQPRHLRTHLAPRIVVTR